MDRVEWLISRIKLVEEPARKDVLTRPLTRRPVASNRKERLRLHAMRVGRRDLVVVGHRRGPCWPYLPSRAPIVALKVSFDLAASQEPSTRAEGGRSIPLLDYGSCGTRG